MAKYDCIDCINQKSPICEHCSVSKMPSGKEMRPRYFVRISQIGRVAEGGIPRYINGCVENGKTISVGVVDKYNKIIEIQSEKENNMTKHHYHTKLNIAPSVLGVVKAQCLDYDRRARLILDQCLPEDLKAHYITLNQVIDDALAKLEVGIRNALFRDIQLGRGFNHSPASPLLAKNTYYSRKWKLVRDIAAGYSLI